MRIQEMRSGLTHLKKRVTPPAAIGTTYDFDDLDAEILTLRTFEETKTTPACDLDAPSWTVVCSTGIEAGGLRYHQAVKLRKELDSHGVSGLCIVTDPAAAKIEPR